MKKSTSYEAPEIQVISIEVESGFAASGKNWYDSEKDGSDVYWEYESFDDLWG